MFAQKSIIEILTPAFSLDFGKVGVSISIIDFCGNSFMNLEGSQSLKNNFLFNLRCRSTLYDFSFPSYGQSKMSKNVTL
jgi:hypothetical protein